MPSTLNEFLEKALEKNTQIDEIIADKGTVKEMKKILNDAMKAVSAVISKVPMTQKDREGVLKDAYRFMGKLATKVGKE